MIMFIGQRQNKEVSISQYPDIDVRGEVKKNIIRACEVVAS